MDYSTLIEILEASVKRNGEKPLTNAWLLSILRMADDRDNKYEYERDQYANDNTLFD